MRKVSKGSSIKVKEANYLFAAMIIDDDIGDDVEEAKLKSAQSDEGKINGEIEEIEEGGVLTQQVLRNILVCVYFPFN